MPYWERSVCERSRQLHNINRAHFILRCARCGWYEANQRLNAGGALLPGCMAAIERKQFKPEVRGRRADSVGSATLAAPVDRETLLACHSQ
jgi:hypothetical protein